MVFRGVFNGALCIRPQLQQQNRTRWLTSSQNIINNQIYLRWHPVRYNQTQAEPDPSEDGEFGQADADTVAGQEHWSTQPHGVLPELSRELKRNHGKRNGRSRKRQSRGRLLTEDAAHLGSEMLGKPAYAIVMREGDLVKKRWPVGGEFDSEQQAERTEAASLLGKDSGPASSEEFRANIDALRPTRALETGQSSIVPLREYQRTKQTLMKGFTVRQLKNYIQWKGFSHTIQDPRRSLDKQFDWARELSEWKPLATSPTTVTEERTEKENQVLQIMRHIWHVEAAEALDGLGMMWVRLHDHDLALLSRGSHSWLDKIGRECLGPHETIEALRGQKKIRITARKTKAIRILQAIGQVLSRIIAKEVHFDYVASSVFEKGVLESVGTMTNSFVRHDEQGQKLVIHWIGSKDTTMPDSADNEPDIEDVRHVVLRLLSGALGGGKAMCALAVYPGDKVTNGRLLLTETNKERWMWKDRKEIWSRLVSPSSTTDTQNEATSAKIAFRWPVTFSSPVTAINPVLTVSPFSPVIGPSEKCVPSASSEQFRWSSMPQTATFAAYGHILHPAFNHVPSTAPGDLLESSMRRLFSPAYPPLSRLSVIANATSESNTPVSTILIRLEPLPQKREDGASNSLTAPDLQLRLNCSESAVIGVDSLRAVVASQMLDILAPSQAVDLRLEQTQYLSLEGPSETLSQFSPLVSFLSKSQLDLEAGKLQTPHKQVFSIPRRLFLTASSQDGNLPFLVRADKPCGTSTSLGKDTGAIEADSIDQAYMFAGLEMRRSISIPYDGYKLNYTSIEAGQGGGRRCEISLEPVQMNPAEKRGDQINEEDFLASCYGIVRNRDFWIGSHP